MGKDVLIFAEINKGELDSTAFELLGKGRELADRLKAKLVALLMGYKLEPIVQMMSTAGADTLMVVDHPRLEGYNTEIYLKVIAEVINNISPSLFLLGYTYKGIEIGPALGVRLGGAMASNCVDLELVDERVRVARPMFSGSIYASVELEERQPYIISFQKGALPKLEVASSPAEVVPMPLEMIEKAPLRSKVIKLLEAAEEGIDITKAEIIVAIGRGIGDESGIPVAKALADALGGTLACSRPVSDLGWLSSAYHVGQSGKMVAPKVYIACGISGASQHVAGIKDSKRIIAINKDPKAPIFKVAHYGIVGDLFEIIPELTKREKS